MRSQPLWKLVPNRKEWLRRFETEDEADVDKCKCRKMKIMNLGGNLETMKASERNAEVNHFLVNIERNRFGMEHLIKKGGYTSIPKLAGIANMTENPWYFSTSK